MLYSRGNQKKKLNPQAIVSVVAQVWFECQKLPTDKLIEETYKLSLPFCRHFTLYGVHCIIKMNKPCYLSGSLETS